MCMRLDVLLNHYLESVTTMLIYASKEVVKGT